MLLALLARLTGAPWLVQSCSLRISLIRPIRGEVALVCRKEEQCFVCDPTLVWKSVCFVGVKDRGSLNACLRAGG